MSPGETCHPGPPVTELGDANGSSGAMSPGHVSAHAVVPWVLRAAFCPHCEAQGCPGENSHGFLISYQCLATFWGSLRGVAVGAPLPRRDLNHMHAPTLHFWLRSLLLHLDAAQRARSMPCRILLRLADLLIACSRKPPPVLQASTLCNGKM